MRSRAVALLPIFCITSGLGPMNAMPLVRADLGEVRVLGEEAVAGVDRVGAGLLGRADDVRDVQVALAPVAGGPM